MLDMNNRLRAARGIAKTETEASIEVFETLQRRGHPDAPSPTILDGWGGIDDAPVEVYGVIPEYQGVGRPPTLKRPQPDWQYLQAVKQQENGRIVGVSLRVIFGDKDDVLGLWGQSTAYVERTHLTMRLFNSRLTRKTRGCSKELEMSRAAAAWEDFIYNFARPLKTLRVETYDAPKRRWKPRTPAMAAGLTEHIWTVKELLTTVVPP